MVFLYTNRIGEPYILSPVERSLNQYGTVRYGTSHMIREQLSEFKKKGNDGKKYEFIYPG